MLITDALRLAERRIEPVIDMIEPNGYTEFTERCLTTQGYLAGAIVAVQELLDTLKQFEE